MRLSTNMIYQQNMNSVSNAQSLWQDTGVQLSTGNRVNKPSDDPLAASQAVMVQQAQAQNDQFAIARTFANQSMGQEENILSNVTNAIQDAQSVIVNAGDGALSDDDRSSLATKLQGIKDQLVNMANTTDGNGRYIFAGYKSDKPPYTVDATTGAVTYSGGEQAITQQVDASRTMTVSHTGTNVFNTITGDAVKEPGTPPAPSETDIFKTLDTAIAALKTPKANFADPSDYTAAIDKSNRGLRNSLNNVLSVRSTLGTQMDELDKLDSMGADTKQINGDKLTALVGTDWTAAISQYSLQQVALQASYKTFTGMQGLSLFQMNS